MYRDFFAPAALTCVFTFGLLSGGVQGRTADRQGFSLVAQVKPGGQRSNNNNYTLIQQIKTRIQQALSFYGSSIPVGYAIGIKSPSLQTIVFIGNYLNNRSKFVLRSQDGNNGAGGIVTTPADMMTWLLFNMGVKQEASLTPLIPVLQTPHTTIKDLPSNCTGIGLGWVLCSLKGLKVVRKDGGVPSFNSWIRFYPEPQSIDSICPDCRFSAHQ